MFMEPMTVHIDPSPWNHKESSMPVVWRAGMTTGNDLIDQDHKYLLALFNSIELALSKPELMRYLPTFFRQLVDYTADHFSREEQIQLKVSYPNYLPHRRQHIEIVERLEALHARVIEELGPGPDDADQDGEVPRPTKDDPEVVRQRLESDVLALAREWVINHVLKADKEMQPYLKAYPRNFA